MTPQPATAPSTRIEPISFAPGQLAALNARRPDRYPVLLESAAEASPLTTAAIAVGAVATVVLGVVPGPVLELAAQASELIR